MHKAAKEYYVQLGVHKLPTIKNLNEQYAELLAEKKKISSNYYPARTQMQEYVKAHHNVKMFLELDDNSVQDQNRRKQKNQNQEL